jgi:hypothetical protein
MSLIVLLVLGAQVGAATPASTPAGRSLPVCGAVRVTAAGQSLPPRNMTFSSREVLDLQLRPRLQRDLPGDHTLRLRLLTPGGFLYQEIVVPFTGAAAPDADGHAAAAPPPRHVAGYPRPLEVQRLAPAADGGGSRELYELRARLAVAGTSITLSSIYGLWTVEPYLDARPEPCGPSTTFTITR